MAKKKVAQESCLFCGTFPCKCEVVSVSKAMREQHSGGVSEEQRVLIEQARESTEASTEDEGSGGSGPVEPTEQPPAE